MSPSPLFRREVFEARRESWLGRAQIAQPLPVSLAAGVALVLVAVVIAYLFLGTYTRRVQAAGNVLPGDGLISVAAPVAGILTGSVPREGSRVSKGDLLFVIDLDARTSDGPAQRRIIDELVKQKETYQRDRDLRLAMAAREKETLSGRLANLAARREQIGRQIDLGNELLPVLKSSVDRLQEATTRRLVANSEFQSQNVAYMQQMAQQAQFQQAATDTDGKLADTRAELAQYDDKLAREVSEIDRSISQLEQRVAESEARRSVEVRAPADGTLTALRVHPGQQVSQGGDLIALLPSSGTLEVNLYLDSAAIGFVRPGASVLLRYAAFPYQRFGLYRGQVRDVARAPFSDPQTSGRAAPANDKNAQVYRVVVDPDLPYVTAYGQREPLQAGMRVEADIAVETRHLYQWLIDPIRQIAATVSVVSGGETP